MSDYTVRYLRSDGTVTMYFTPNCCSDADASRQAASHMRPEFARAEIWRDLDCLAVLHAADVARTAPPKAA